MVDDGGGGPSLGAASGPQLSPGLALRWESGKTRPLQRKGQPVFVSAQLARKEAARRGQLGIERAARQSRAQVFRRADKNDDGKLSFEEFQNYFADGVLSPGELRELFRGVEGHPADNLETEKLCDYFSEHLGVYRPVLAALESLNRAVLSAMDATKLVSDAAGGRGA
ncbi:N-terminal EF-hand calcium-binding protein 3 [Carlito syrichta]|uniref:N-terminal EF-hand calcium-binding protein 3 n=1 Tax=Carlito syrichta TaxID=1868482 RepID=A0A3Q0DQC6_CARSF|nr:N-terminal EF-hand calcium-binding protein 3 [Carlito syrichta]